MPQHAVALPPIPVLVRARSMSLRAGLASISAAAYCTISLLTRLALMLAAYRSGQLSAGEMPRVLLTGFAYDVITSLYLIAPLVVVLAVMPARLLAARGIRFAMYCVLGAALFGITYLGMVEYFFFDEFNARFNFVAVEYLIYPHEVFVNIWQSYPVGRALALAAAVTVVGVAWARPRIRQLERARDGAARFRRQAAALVAVGIVVTMGVDLDTGRTQKNRVADELAANGIYSFVNAAVNSRLDYTDFYMNVPESEAAARVRSMVEQDNASFIPGATNPLARKIVYPAPAKLLNVVVILAESLGAEFVGAYGDRRGLTPNLDGIAAESIMFTRTYATGTRTVRGMEAVTASFPPVPAESIVKRPHNEGMFNWSTVMREAGYTPTFIYGGYGTFDSMNQFFGTNGYRVVDRTDMDKPRFSNIWGVSDEDLFQHAFKVFDQQHGKGERIFSVVMTTSNHKPFTFPEGIEGVKPKGGGREAGVRYADHAIGRFIAELKTKPYSDNTAVVIVADHGARVYGKQELPLHTYDVPFVVYAPRHFTPRRVDTVTSQVDVAPTVLGLLGISYESAFFGRDVLAGSQAAHAVPLNHNRTVALLEGDTLHQLGFQKTSASVPANDGAPVAKPTDAENVRNAASYFQLAYLLYARRQYGVR